MVEKIKNKLSGSIVTRISATLRDVVLKSKDGAFLGSESDLLARLSVSRPTFRQAAKLVEQEQLLVIKRGVGGGFFARKPTSQGVAHVAAVYLHTHRATIENAIRAARPLFAEIARLAARCENPARSERLIAFLASQDQNPSDDDRVFLRSEREFLDIFGSLSGNPVLQLYANVLVDFAGTFVASSVYAHRPDRVAQYRGLRRNLIQAIISGDAELAGLLSLRRSDAIVHWMESDMHGEGASSKRPIAKRSQRADRQLIGVNSINDSSNEPP
jgi:DNA-binding FadR family transcriptional regulator